MTDKELERLKVLESVSAMLSQKEIKLSSPKKFDESSVVDAAASLADEKTKLKSSKSKYEKAVADYRAMVGRKWSADKRNLDHYVNVKRIQQTQGGLQEACRAQQSKNQEVQKAGEERIEEIRKGTEELRSGLGKDIESIEETILQDEKVLAEKEEEWKIIKDDLQRMMKHRTGQQEQLAAVRDMITIQKKLGSAKDQQREHALGHFQKQRDSQAHRLEEKENTIKEFEDMGTDLKSRDASLRQHLDTNAPILESYREKEDLMKKQVELLKTREKLAKEGLRNAESRTIASVFTPGDSQVERLKASNAIKKAQAKALSEKLKAAKVGA